MHAKGTGGPDLEELLAGAYPAREGQEGVRVHLHQRLALTHRVGDEKLVDALVGDLPGDPNLAHTREEYVDTARITRSAEVLRRFLS